MKCPVCKEPNLVMSDRNGIEIDYCPECRGIWLDRGELDKILERSKSEAPAFRQDNGYQQQQAPPQQQHHSGSYQKPYKRKKSFLEEIFD